MAPTTLRNNNIIWIDDKTTSGVLDGCIAVERRRSSFIIRGKRYYSCNTAQSVYGESGRQQPSLKDQS
eukprot:scaffold8854_cov97-Skeletonema_dohrnii-CCMP3373.AAC.5